MATHNDELSTGVESLSYDFESREGKLVMGEDCCCDMRGCCRLFERIDPEVKIIRTYAQKKPDIIYFKNKDNEWDSKDVRKL